MLPMPARPRRTIGRAARALAALALATTGLAAPSCSSVLDDPTPVDPAPEEETLAPGELCDTPSPEQVRLRFEPSFVVVPPCDGDACVARKVEVIVDPDFCERTAVTFESSDAAVVPAPAEAAFGLHKPVVELSIEGGKLPEGAAGASATITVRVPKGDGTDAEATLAVDVLDPTLAECSGAAPASTPALAGGDTLRGEGGLAGASIALPEGADKPNEGSFLWSVTPFPASIACGDAEADVPAGYVALGPAITFGPVTQKFRREVPLAVPINPALLPEPSRWRHLRLAYSGPAADLPRTVPVADPRVEKIDGQWVVTFKAPRLGTYQAVVRADAGATTRPRRLTHRALIGVSMGGGGTATFGMRHHHLFDVLAPLGGPVDWTWLLDHLARNNLGGFRAIPPGTTLPQIQLAETSCTSDAACQADETCLGVLAGAPGKCALLPAPRDPYEHPSTFNHWWYEFPREGTGGQFSRTDYVQIFRDLAVMYGNPNGDNLTPGGENLPAGVHPDDPSVVGDHPNGACRVTVDPIDGHPDHDAQQALADSCPAERCAHTLTLTNYFDDEYNPDGVFPVITVCDGTPQDEALTPYANTWGPDGNGYPLELALAVDYNGNGVRDELEPIIRAGYEPYDDFGVDNVPSALEPGYAPGVNEDPAGDDYDPQYNPAGTEDDHRWQAGETFYDVGLDGVAGTPQQPPGGWAQPGDGYDVGEGDGVFTAARGLRRFWERDAHGIVRQMSEEVPGGALDDAALARLDVWTDGGTRDIFNFAVAAQHLAGTYAARGRDVAYFTDFTQVPGLDPALPQEFLPSHIVYKDLQGVVLQRYGKLDPTPEDIAIGSGQHVGSVDEIAARLQSALYFIGSRWQEPELRTFMEEDNADPVDSADPCALGGNCAFEFTSTTGRTGPVSVGLPPGYGHKLQQDRRYPVIYMLHGYGQEPSGLAAASLFLRGWMNSPTDSMASRLPKAILVYVDGRCRVVDGEAECIRGTFYADSALEGRALDETWFLELIGEVDRRFRTMGETSAEWAE